MESRELFLEETRIALQNALSDQTLVATLATYGYDATRLQEGLALYENARTLLQSHGDALLTKLNASSSFNTLWKQAHVSINHDIRIVRLVLKHSDEPRYFLNLETLSLYQNYERWLGQTREFYHRLSTNSALQRLVSPHGITHERVEQGVQLLQRLDVARIQQKAERGNITVVYQQRNDAFDTLNTWMTVFRQFARIAFAEAPEQLAILGMKSVVRKQSKKGEQKILPPIDASLAFAAVNQMPTAQEITRRR